MLRAGAITAAVLVVAAVFGFVAVLPLAGLAGLAGGGRSGGEDPPLDTTFAGGDVKAKDKLLVIPVHGEILGRPSGGDGLGGLSGTYGYEVHDQLVKAAADDDVKGVILDMDTPGGTIFGAEAIATGVREYQKRSGNKVVAYVGGIAASGGMWAMAGADRIVADHGTLIGSIGVIFGPIVSYDQVVAIDGGILGGGVTTKGGISSEYITAGRGKSAGDPFRKLTPEERAVIQRGVSGSYGEFVSWVSSARGIPRATIVGRIAAHAYDERTARDLKLIDEIGDRDRAWQQAAELNGLGGKKYRVEEISTGGGLLSLLGIRDQEEAPTAAQRAGALSPLCGRQAAVLAYAGNLTRLCSPAAASTP
jgi:protease-4